MNRPSILRALAMLAIVLLPVAAPAQAAAATRIDVKGMPDDAPLTIVASHDAATLRLAFDLKDGWHLYGRDVGGGQPVEVRITGGVFEAAGKLVTPMNGEGLITGKGELLLPLRRTGDGAAIQATMSFMVCDALQCLPPIELELRSAQGKPQDGPCKVLLVAIDDGERTQRIAAFLRERGFVPTVATYATVTAEQCDAHDVVLADSPTFNQTRGKKANTKDFPKTESPVVAVGFLGTQILVAHKVAMACGYI